MKSAAFTEAGGSLDAARSGSTVELPLGESDLRAGVLHGLGEFHGSPGCDALVEA